MEDPLPIPHRNQVQWNPQPQACLSVHGHVSDAGLWWVQTLEQQGAEGLRKQGREARLPKRTSSENLSCLLTSLKLPLPRL